MRYDLSALEILEFLGFQDPAGREAMDALERRCGLPLPKTYRAFMEAAWDCPLLATGDLWCGKMIPLHMEPAFLFDPVQAKEKGLPNYLEIGSDYCTGMLTFGLRMEDLEQEDPPVWQNHDFESNIAWKIANERLSDFLLEVVLGELASVNYDTAREALEAMGWVCASWPEEFWAEHPDGEEAASLVTEAALAAKGMDPARVRWTACPYGGKLFCCADEERGALYIGRWACEGEENTLLTIRRAPE